MNALGSAKQVQMKSAVGKWANIAKLLLAGALGGIAVVNTIALLLGNQPPSDSAEKIGMGIGAAVFAVLLKLTHII